MASSGLKWHGCDFGCIGGTDGYGIFVSCRDDRIREAQRDVVFPHNDHLRFTRTNRPFPEVSHQRICVPIQFHFRIPKEGNGRGGERRARELSSTFSITHKLTRWWVPCDAAFFGPPFPYTRHATAHAPRCWTCVSSERGSAE